MHSLYFMLLFWAHYDVDSLDSLSFVLNRATQNHVYQGEDVKNGLLFALEQIIFVLIFTL